MRCYGGLFTDYVYVDEGLISQQSGVKPQQTYLILKNLSQRNIIHFIPQRKTPYITYTCDHVDAEMIIIPKEVYEMRKEQFVKRIGSVVNYATNSDLCRSRQLLRYFGEHHTQDCEQCDVCIGHHGDNLTEDRLAAKQRIMELLEDGEKHNVSELKTINSPKNKSTVPQYLIDEGVIFFRVKSPVKTIIESEVIQPNFR